MFKLNFYQLNSLNVKFKKILIDKIEIWLVMPINVSAV